MAKLSSKDIFSIYHKLKRCIFMKYYNRDYYMTLKYINVASYWMYWFNEEYSDYDIECVIKQISSELLPRYNVTAPVSSRVVFIDNFGLDNRGLTQQYLRGLMALGKDILYILHSASPNINTEIIQELKEYNKSTIKIYRTRTKNFIDIAKKIADNIYQFAPKDIMFHIAPWDVVSLMSVSRISGVIKYNINLTDHAFWLGSTFIDYNIEFRGYGEAVSLQKRGLTKRQIVRLPFYPIVSKYTSFQGFPDMPQNSVKVLCGGAEYKMLGKNDIFFKLMDIILEISPNVRILVAGISRDSVFGAKVEKIKNKSRVYLLGDRKDINEVFCNSDIYLSSYPFIGGLMSQYAAYNSIPILSYAEPNEKNTVESLINHFDKAAKSQNNICDFVAYAKKLIENEEFRVDMGAKCNKAMITCGEFQRQLKIILERTYSTISWELEQPDYKYMAEYYLDVENYMHAAIKGIFRILKLKAFFFVPSQISIMIMELYKHLKCKIKIA